MSKIIRRRVGVPILALSLAVGVGACGSNAAGSSSPAVEAVVEHKPAEVKSALDAFFVNVSEESDAYMKEAMTKGSAKVSDEEKAANFKKAYPKSYKYLEMDDKKAAALIGIFALTAMFTPNTEITANESGIVIDGEKASIKGSDIKIKGLEKSGQGGDDGKLSKIVLTYKGSEWKVTDLEVQQ